MKRYVILLLSLFFAVPLAAQSRREALLEYQARRRQAYAEFQDNYRKACADFMRKRWEAFRSEAPVPLPERKEPPQPVVKQPDESGRPRRTGFPIRRWSKRPFARFRRPLRRLPRRKFPALRRSLTGRKRRTPLRSRNFPARKRTGTVRLLPRPERAVRLPPS